MVYKRISREEHAFDEDDDIDDRIICMNLLMNLM